MESWRQMLDVNVLAACLCTQLSLASMARHGVTDGQIVFLSSMSGHRVPASPSGRFYSATKFAVTGLLEGWRQEVHNLFLCKYFLKQPNDRQLSSVFILPNCVTFLPVNIQST